MSLVTRNSVLIDDFAEVKWEPKSTSTIADRIRLIFSVETFDDEAREQVSAKDVILESIQEVSRLTFHRLAPRGKQKYQLVCDMSLEGMDMSPESVKAFRDRQVRLILTAIFRGAEAQDNTSFPRTTTAANRKEPTIKRSIRSMARSNR